MWGGSWRIFCVDNFYLYKYIVFVIRIDLGYYEMYLCGFFVLWEILCVYFFEIMSRCGSGEMYILFLLEFVLK